MAKSNSTRTCAVCGTTYVYRRSDGSGYKVCSMECRRALYPQTEYTYVRKPPEPTECKVCGSVFQSINGKKYCSKECRNKRSLNRPRKRGAHRPVDFVCQGCLVWHRVIPKGGKYSFRYCSMPCFLDHRRRISSEKERLRSIGDRMRRKFPADVSRIVLRRHVWLEVQALRGIRSRIKTRINGRAPRVPFMVSSECGKCGDSFKAVGRSGKRRCNACLADTRKKHRRTDKTRRKASARGARGAHRIDPIQVFVRDKWKCHLCGRKTDETLRGSYEDRAPELDHIIPIAAGGKHEIGNVACSCRKCNGMKGAREVGQLGLGIPAS